ncbi:hypothetical protein MKY41_11570 [Sporosarcina sp. FSL W7-1349]|uniref:hypothetical protein n=1 Tax=Sporosarcina sp. FSL W7-1349 TaxID=2921561 RepID=UPI0030FAC436
MTALIDETIEYGPSNRMKRHPDYHFAQGTPIQLEELIYLCKFHESEPARTISFALGRTESTLQNTVSRLKRDGMYDDLKKGWDRRIGIGDEDMTETIERTAERGRLLKTIAVYSPGRNGRMKHEVGFVVSRTRPFQDILTIAEHEDVCKKARLSRYGQSLFDSCFKNW